MPIKGFNGHFTKENTRWQISMWKYTQPYLSLGKCRFNHGEVPLQAIKMAKINF